MALRTAQYKSINVIDVHEGELKSWNPLSEELIIDFDSKKSDAIIGYAGYFELLNGFRKSVYWSKEKIEAHRKKFSKSDFGWNNDYNAMAEKTVIRNMLSKWGSLSVEIQTMMKLMKIILSKIHKKIIVTLQKIIVTLQAMKIMLQ